MQRLFFSLSLFGSRETERETPSLFFSKEKKEKERIGSRSIERKTGTRRSIYFWHVFAYIGTRHSRDYTSALQISHCNAQPRPIIYSLVQIELLKRIPSRSLLFPIKNSSKCVYLASTTFLILFRNKACEWTNEEDLQNVLEQRVGYILWNLNKGMRRPHEARPKNKKIRIFA